MYCLIQKQTIDTGLLEVLDVDRDAMVDLVWFDHAEGAGTSKLRVLYNQYADD